MKSRKEKDLAALSAYHEKLWREPELRQLFLELTLRCNMGCFHCGSNCTANGGEELTLDDYKRILDEVKEDFDISRIQLCITGGEPLLRREFFEIMAYAHALGYRWGMTTNATLINKETAHKLAETGMSTVSVSLDGLPETHDELRGMKGGFERAMRGVQNMIDEGAFRHIQITSVFNHKNISELDAMFDMLKDVDIDSWRVVNLEPIGRALSRPDLMLTKEDYRRLFSFIREKREEGWPVVYGCSHFLGLDLEGEVRDWYWICNAGVYTASVMANGDIGACLDIERRPETVFGNVKTDRFSDVWKNSFGIFRRNPGKESEKCRDCRWLDFCRGDSRHSWDYDKNEPLVCFRGTLFE